MQIDVKAYEQTQWSNVGHAQGDLFCPPALPFPAKNFKGKHVKEPLSRKKRNQI